MKTDYSEIVERFRETFKRNGAREDENYPWFAPADKEKLTYLTDLYDTFSYRTQVYPDNELEVLREYKVPDVVVDFYAQYEPKQIPMTHAGIYILDLESIKDENASGVLIKYGLITIATTIGGDLVCIDLNDKRDDSKVLLIESWQCSSPEYVSDYDYVCEIAHVVENKFSDFIWKLSGDEYEDFEDMFLCDD